MKHGKATKEDITGMIVLCILVFATCIIFIK
jgi:hypothetical protein